MVILGKEAYADARKMTKEKLEPMKQTFIDIIKEAYEKCVVCGSITPYNKNDNISIRLNYIEGAGQLCDKCFIGIHVVKKD